ELRRGAEGRRRGRIEEGLRPPSLGQGRRGRDGRPDRGSLPGIAFSRYQPGLMTTRQIRRRGVVPLLVAGALVLTGGCGKSDGSTDSAKPLPSLGAPAPGAL